MLVVVVTAMLLLPAQVVPPDWSCDSERWANGECDCGCTAFDEADCDDDSAAACDRDHCADGRGITADHNANCDGGGDGNDDSEGCNGAGGLPSALALVLLSRRRRR